VVSYDIRDDRRRTRVAETLLGFGARIQASVYELWLEERALERMWVAVGREVAAEDLVRCYVLCAGCVRRARSYGMAMPEEKEVFVI
jgi:CRISPR-associated protein Cas2